MEFILHTFVTIIMLLMVYVLIYHYQIGIEGFFSKKSRKRMKRKLSKAKKGVSKSISNPIPKSATKVIPNNIAKSVPNTVSKHIPDKMKNTIQKTLIQPIRKVQKMINKQLIEKEKLENERRRRKIEFLRDQYTREIHDKKKEFHNNSDLFKIMQMNLEHKKSEYLNEEMRNSQLKNAIKVIKLNKEMYENAKGQNEIVLDTLETIVK